MGGISSFSPYSFIFFKASQFWFGPSMANWVIVSIVGDEGNPFKSSYNTASAVVLYWNCDARYFVSETLLSEHRKLTWSFICSISRTNLCESSNDTLKHGDFETWFINFCLIHWAMPNLISYMHFVLLGVKLETAGLSLKISLKNSKRPALVLNDERCFLTFSTYFIYAVAVLFFTSNMLLVKIENWTLEQDWVSFRPGVLVLEYADNSGVFSKKPLVFNTSTFFAALNSFCVFPLAYFFKASSTSF